MVGATGVYFAGCASVHRLTVEASVQSGRVAPKSQSYRIVDREAGAGQLRLGEIASHVRTALSAQGLYEATDVESADMVVEIDYGIEAPRVQRNVYQELINGRPVPAIRREGPPPEGVAREMMGYSSMATLTVVREKHLSICARENTAREDAQPPADLWRVHVSLENESDDLRGHLPILAAVAMDHVGRATNGPETVTLRRSDEAMRFVRKGL